MSLALLLALSGRSRFAVFRIIKISRQAEVFLCVYQYILNTLSRGSENLNSRFYSSVMQDDATGRRRYFFSKK
jgi:hypothetical protein